MGILILLEIKPPIDISAVNEGSFRWTCRHEYIDVVRYLLGIKKLQLILVLIMKKHLDGLVQISILI